MSQPVRTVKLSHSVGTGNLQQRILHELDQEFPPGKLTCVSGPSGAGKTTLLSLLSGTVRPAQGTVLHGGVDVYKLSERERLQWKRCAVALVFQTSRLIDVLSVQEQLRMSAELRNRPLDPQGSQIWLKRLGIAEKLDCYPSQLSGGEKQRVAIAQAVLAGPTILLADEPTASLDELNSRTVGDLLLEFARETQAVVIAVSHDLELIERADATVRLAKA